MSRRNKRRMKSSLGLKAQFCITGDDKHERYGDSAALRSECPRTKPSAMVWSLSKPVLNILPHCFLRFVYFPSPLTPLPPPPAQTIMSHSRCKHDLSDLALEFERSREAGRFFATRLFLIFDFLVQFSTTGFTFKMSLIRHIFIFFYRDGGLSFNRNGLFFLVHVQLWRMLHFNICWLHIIK